MTRHFLDITDLSLDELHLVLDLSKRASLPKVLDGKGAALIFEKPSNRTRHSMEMAVVQLGGHPIYTRGEEVGFDVREPVEDITRVMAGYHAVLAARVFEHSVVARMAAVSPVPVVNMLSDLSHPLQALADVLAMEEVHGSLAGHRVAFVGDWNNVSRSLAEACIMLGAEVSLGCPQGYDVSDDELVRLGSLGSGSVVQTDDVYAAVAGATAVHTDTWTSMGARPRRPNERRSSPTTPSRPPSWHMLGPTRASTTACRPTAATRWPPTSSTARRAMSFGRPISGCTLPEVHSLSSWG